MTTDTLKPRRTKTAAAPVQANEAGAPMRFLDTYLAALLARASSLISDEFHATIARKKIPALQWRVLACLSDGPLPMGDLGRLVLAKQPTVSKLIDRMEAAGLVVRQEDPASRRRTLVAPSSRSRRAHGARRPARDRTDRARAGARGFGALAVSARGGESVRRRAAAVDRAAREVKTRAPNRRPRCGRRCESRDGRRTRPGCRAAMRKSLPWPRACAPGPLPTFLNRFPV